MGSSLANDATIHILGFSNFEELSFCNSTDLYDKQVRDQLLQELTEAKEVSDFRFTISRKDGKKIVVSLFAKINSDKGYIEGTITDVTGVVSLEASVLIPHLKKMSLLKQHIMEKINGECCDSEFHKASKTA